MCVCGEVWQYFCGGCLEVESVDVFCFYYFGCYCDGYLVVIVCSGVYGFIFVGCWFYDCCIMIIGVWLVVVVGVGVVFVWVLVFWLVCFFRQWCMVILSVLLVMEILYSFLFCLVMIFFSRFSLVIFLLKVLKKLVVMNCVVVVLFWVKLWLRQMKQWVVLCVVGLVIWVILMRNFGCLFFGRVELYRCVVILQSVGLRNLLCMMCDVVGIFFRLVGLVQIGGSLVGEMVCISVNWFLLILEVVGVFIQFGDLMVLVCMQFRCEVLSRFLCRQMQLDFRLQQFLVFVYVLFCIYGSVVIVDLLVSVGFFIQIQRIGLCFVIGQVCILMFLGYFVMVGVLMQLLFWLQCRLWQLQIMVLLLSCFVDKGQEWCMQ